MSSPVVIRVLPDGSGRVRIHYFVTDPKGPVRTTGRTAAAPGVGVIVLGGAEGYVACQPGLTSIQPVFKNGEIWPLAHSNEARAVTCPECRATEAWKKTMEQIEQMLAERA